MKTAIFDFDGTVVDSREAIVDILKQMSSEFGFREVSWEEMLELRELPVQRRLRALGIRSWKIPRIAKRSLELFSDHMTTFPVYSGVREMLFCLHASGIETQILSSNNVSNIELCLEANDLQCFSNIYSARGIFAKHRALKRILRKQRIPRSEAVYIGDELRDVEAARRAGITAVAVTWGYDSPSLLRSGNPDCLAEEPADISRFLGAFTSDQDVESEAVSTSLRAADRESAPK